jgi:hypothetical protein
VPEYRRIYARGSNADVRYRRWLGARVGPLLRRHGLGPKATRTADQTDAADPSWPNGSLVAGAETTEPVRPEQLELLL